MSAGDNSTAETEQLPPIGPADLRGSPTPGLALVFSRGAPLFRPLPVPAHRPMTIGRSRAADLVVDDAACSSVHLTVAHDGARWTFRDAQSSNGTFVDGARIAERTFDRAPRRVRIGKSVLLVAPDLGALAAPDALLATHGLVAGRALRAALDTAARAAAAGATVLALGESGTGKEIVARWVHAHGRHPRGELVEVNTAARTESLAPSLFFGAARGAHSGAHRDVPGYFARAHHGTLFIDEVGDMPLDVQALLLRAVQDRVVTPLGGKPIALELGLVAATNRDLPALIARGEFRRDFYERLANAVVRLPPLRERPEEIPWHLVRHARAKGETRPVSAEFVDEAIGYAWPGNVRELEFAVERAVRDAGRAELYEALPREGAAGGAFGESPAGVVRGSASVAGLPAVGTAAVVVEDGRVVIRPQATLDQVEEMRVREALEKCRGNQTKAAAMLGRGGR